MKPFAALLLVIAAAGCRKPPLRVTAQTLFMHREQWLGKRVIVDGTLELFSPGAGQYFAVEDQGFRVGLKGGDPAVLKDDVGRRISAEGEFGFVDGFGAYVSLERLDPAR
jgi:hypothetical protein